jgi:hypothetical protein
MGQKINPIGYRSGISKNGIQRWFFLQRKTTLIFTLEDKKDKNI